MIDDDGRERDRLNRVVPHRMNPLTFERAMPGYLRRFTAIPAKAYDADSETVTCPCGGTPKFTEEQVLIGCDCERVFLRTSKEVLVANSPVREGSDS